MHYRVIVSAIALKKKQKLCFIMIYKYSRLSSNFVLQWHVITSKYFETQRIYATEFMNRI